MSQSALTVFAPAAFASALNALEQDIEPGLFSFAYGPAAGPAPNSITSRLQAGEQSDLAILPMGLAEAEIAAGRLVGVPVRVFASTVAFCVAPGAEVPDLSTEVGLWKALSDAPSIGLSAAGSGTFFRNVLVPVSGQADALTAKLQTITDRSVGQAVAEGLVALGFQQKAELLEVDGITVIDDLADVARNDTWLALAQGAGGRSPAKNALFEHMRSARGQQILAEHGLTPAP
ncbi:substrate-binding domain-containing protein [Primorskyibacter sp. 2E233]|uniref:substrate-binding domain-containing protein n=1 Tax=Primorskyibacter sp. 2E233 TaxID=3413431 RepID=UPI003BF166E6